MAEIKKLLLMMFTATILQGCGDKVNGLIGNSKSREGENFFRSDADESIKTKAGDIAGELFNLKSVQGWEEYDKKMMHKIAHQALDFSPSGSSVEWKNPSNKNHGSITPIKSFKISGRYCRQYIQEIYIGPKKIRVFGKACRQADGSWKIIK